MAYRMLTDLPAALRASGAPIVLVPGWDRRGRPASTGSFDPRGQVVHHTGGHGTRTRAQELDYVKRVLVAGFAHLPGPLCQLSLGQQTVDGPPVIYVVAAGRANHAGKSRARGFMRAGDGNSQSVGWEAINSGAEGWTDAQLDTYHRGVASLADHYGWPRTNVLGHGESSTAGKWDPGINGRMIDMAAFRRAVTNAEQGADMAITNNEAKAIAREVWRYKNTDLEKKDAYSFLRQAARPWSYKRKGEKRDASQILVDIEARLDRIEGGKK